MKQEEERQALGISCCLRSEKGWTKQLTLSNSIGSPLHREFSCKGLARPTLRRGLIPWWKRRLNVCLRFQQGLCLMGEPNQAENKCWPIPEEEIHSFWGLGSEGFTWCLKPLLEGYVLRITSWSHLPGWIPKSQLHHGVSLTEVQMFWDISGMWKCRLSHYQEKNKHVYAYISVSISI